MASFVEKQHSWIGIFTSTLDALITAVVDDAVEFSFQAVCQLGIFNLPVGLA